MSSPLLALNAGSSTLKFAVYADDGERALASGTISSSAGSSEERLSRVLAEATRVLGEPPSLIAHRIVHGGPRLTAPVIVDAAVMSELERLQELAPLHLPPALLLLHLARARLPTARHVAVFDTAFHRGLPQISQHFALAPRYFEQGVRRYGFHGLSCEYALSVLGGPPPHRSIIAHLGSGASLTAVLDGESFDTTMGLTPTGGIPMGSRSGDLDPGVVIHLLRHGGFSLDEVEHLLNERAGLKGVGGSADMVELLGRHDDEARLAVSMFCYAVKKQIGAYVAALGGLDCLVFTGGIGERSPEIRERALEGLEALGIELDSALNAENAAVVSRTESRVHVRVIVADEALMMARAAWRLLAAG